MPLVTENVYEIETAEGRAIVKQVNDYYSGVDHISFQVHWYPAFGRFVQTEHRAYDAASKRADKLTKRAYYARKAAKRVKRTQT
jgi:hypothetical protein